MHRQTIIKRISFRILAIVIFTVLIDSPLLAQAYQGYTLYAPNNSKYTYLANMNNQTIQTWNHTRTGGYSSYLLPDGTLMRTATSGGSSLNGGGAQGVVQRVDWKGNLLWEYTYATSSVRAHHDIEPMPNGNVLIIAWESKTAAQAVAAGLNRSSSIWPDHIIEVQPVGTSGGNIVWKWHAWDHLIQDYDPTKANYGVVANHPELLDINLGGNVSGDWMHINSITYNPELDQIAITSHTLNEIYVIDHSTTIAEAASHSGGRYGKGGDFLYRWGCPANYRATGTQVFRVVHCAYWIPKGLPGEGHLLAYNNRQNLGTSEVIEIIPPYDSLGFYHWTPGTAYGPAAPVWKYTAPDFYSNHLGANQRLPNGNTIISESTSGFLFEVDSAGNRVWTYNRGGEIVRVLRYGFDDPAVKMLAQGSVVINEVMVMNGLHPDPAGDLDSWVELYNTTDQEISLAGKYLSNVSGTPNKWRFPLNTKIPANGYVIVWLDNEQTEPGLHTGFTLSASGDKLGLYNYDHTVIDTTSFGQQSQNLSMMRIPNGTGPFMQGTPTFGSANAIVQVLMPGELVISEVMAQNTTIQDPAGEYDAWIELLNTSQRSLDLSGVRLADSESSWEFPQGVSIEPSARLIVWMDGDVTQQGLHASFLLKANGGELTLKNGQELLVDTLMYGVSPLTYSLSRIPDDGGMLQRTVPTPGAVNKALSLIQWGLVVNELLAINENIPDPDGEFDPWVELFNLSGGDIDLSGAVLRAGADTLWYFPAGTGINEAGYLVLWADGQETQQGLHTSFRLSDTGDQIELLNFDMSPIDTCLYSAPVANISLARYPDGTGAFVPSYPTIGATNNQPMSSDDTRHTVTEYYLDQNYPNPFNPTTTISFGLVEKSYITLRVYDMLGGLVQNMYQGLLDAGRHSVVLNATGLSSGVYLYRLTAGSTVLTKKLCVLK